ncbi:MAG: 3-oxoacyl-[acyl-carrier-protein] reductase [Fusobacteriaceae bacterium]
MKRVEGKIALVTGSARGIGRAVVERLAEEGATLVISCDMGEATYEQKNVRHEILNVTDREAVASLVAKIEAEFGRIDILVNNAGITKDALLVRMKEDQWDDVINVNLKGVFNITQAVAPLMTKNKVGSIITLSSVVGLYGNVGQTNYAATKGGVITMTKTWAKELARKGAQIRANCVAPGFIITPMTVDLPEKVIEGMKEKTPLGRMGEPQDIANAVLFLASEESSFITGQVLAVTGGLVM